MTSNDVGLFSIRAVDNDDCVNVDYVFSVPATGLSFTYTTTTATLETNVSIPCGGASEATGPGVWYRVQGNGQPMTASTCSEVTDFDTQISVFKGECGNLECVNGNNDAIGCGLKSSVTWGSDLSEDYTILVHGFNGEVGTFELQITSDVGRHEHDLCENAKEIDLDSQSNPESSSSFNLAGSTVDPDIPRCDSFYVDLLEEGNLDEFEDFFYSGHLERDFFGGVWFQVAGEETQIQFETQFNRNKIFFAFYSGSCGNLVCEKLNIMEAECLPVGFGTGISSCSISNAYFDAAPEKMYYIFVGGLSLESTTEDETYFATFRLEPPTTAPTSNGIE